MYDNDSFTSPPSPVVSSPSSSDRSAPETLSPRRSRTSAVKDSVRTSLLWVWGVILCVLVSCTMIFIMQNLHNVEVNFLSWRGYPPLAAALIIALLLGASMVGVVMSWQLWRLRHAINKMRKITRDLP